MKQLSVFILIFLILSVGVSLAERYFPANISPTGALDWSVYQYTDDTGDVIRTIPSPQPLQNNSLVGACWAEDMLIVFENTYPHTLPSKFYQIDPDDGTIINEITLLFNGYVMGASYDGAGIWVVNWYPENVMYKIDLSGNIISQFNLSTSPYSCRLVNVDGDYLWVGANANANNTKLYKMDMSGAVLEEYDTGIQVGWYMGGEIDTQAPAGSNLFVVDDIGHVIKRLNIAGGVVTVIEEFGSPVDSSDFAEGLAFDGEYLWHNSAYAYQNLIWCIDDGFGASPSEVTITLTPAVTPITIPPGGGSFDYQVSLANNGTASHIFTAWIDVTLPDSSIFGPLIQRELTLNAGASLMRDMSQYIPAGAPAGDYSYNGYVGVYPDTVWDSDNFPFTKTGADGFGYQTGWELTGWDEEIAAGDYTATTFSLQQNYPNPFNPETYIAFTLPASGKTSLKIYNTLGEEVADLIHGYLTAGEYTITFNGANLSSGIYLCVLKSGSHQTIKKMTLLK